MLEAIPYLSLPNRDPIVDKGDMTVQKRPYFGEFNTGGPHADSCEGSHMLTEQRALQRKKFTLTLRILLSSMILMA